jgi:hypothetical protein
MAASIDQALLQAGLASSALPVIPDLFTQQQAGIFGGGPAKEEAAALRNDPRGFIERKFGSAKKQKARTQAQRVKDARALGDLARSQGIETTPALGQGIATQLQSTFGGQGAAQLLAEREQQLPSNVAATEQLLRDQRKERQRAGVEFAQQTANRELERQIKAQTLEQNKLIGTQAATEAKFFQDTGFKNPKDMVDTTLQIQSTGSALDSIDSMIKIREDIGAIGPLDFMSNPAAAAAVKDFQKFEATNLFKTLANDTRLSDEDRIFYNSIIDLSVSDILFTGGKVELNQLKNMQKRLESTMQTYQLGFSKLAEGRPELFQRTNFDDIGPAFQFEPVSEQSLEQQQALGLTPGASPSFPLPTPFGGVSGGGGLLNR